MALPLRILLIHGFGGDEREVLPLARLLSQRGYDCHVVHLAGHGKDRTAIDNLPWGRWVESARQQVAALGAGHRVVLVGFSMGGLIGTILQGAHPFAAMVFINTPIYFWHLPQILKNFQRDFAAALHRYLIHSAGQVTPYTMWQFYKLLRYAKPLVSQVRCPALVVQADDDDSVWPCSASYIRDHLTGSVTLFRVKAGGHRVLAHTTACAQIARQVEIFLQHHLGE